MQTNNRFVFKLFMQRGGQEGKLGRKGKDSTAMAVAGQCAAPAQGVIRETLQ
jgi:hypothetical protein